MGSRKPKGKSKGFGDTIAKITHATGLNKVAEAVAKAAGHEDCGCGRRQDKLNELFPYKVEEINFSQKRGYAIATKILERKN